MTPFSASHPDSVSPGTARAAMLDAILSAAFCRSFTRPLPEWSEHLPPGVVAWLDLASPAARSLPKARGKRQKILAFGMPSPELRAGILPLLGLRHDAPLPSLAGQDACQPCAEGRHHAQSRGMVRYASHPLSAALASPLRERPFVRFDFADEWNNLGFGPIRADGSIWSASEGIACDGAAELAAVAVSGEGGAPDAYAGSYMALFDTPDGSILWCSRPAGPVDSAEWSIVERFVSDWRPDELPCLPSLRQTPDGCRAIVTMRLDCDEAISSARDVFEWYAAEGIPFSLAVKTCLPMETEDVRLLRDVAASGGTLLSHSHTHPVNWGASPEEARREAVVSRGWFREALPELPEPDLAVSPFHTNPPYAMRALEESGFRGVVSGIIHNDPEYLIGRAGRLPFTAGRLLSISQQSMLHGDCYRQQGESVAVHEDAFASQYEANGIFGYLDHPFSPRYQYGWDSKAQRLEAHKKLVRALRGKPGVWFWNQQECFEFLRTLDAIRLECDGKKAPVARGLDPASPWRPVCRWRGEERALVEK